ncbi:phosphomannomutase/phosphoglucomutase [Micromonospora sp. CP22]|uniref:phosphomannomutase/phosphoglucomutase n=1 Tax=Micromonospora sp. CP22 TaxID=2580517 RepID=UPI001324E795|nr:phosphomannomutase/phosphoglucomutase [Micromonospora sp. CP22]MTK01252.1 phosphomannomutase/phosphoglucomutase [Micromonospora sp. CP22]
MADLSRIVKAYDVRGTVPEQWDERVAGALGVAFAQMLDTAGEPGQAVLIGHDMRASGPGLAAAFATGVRAEGRPVIEIGLASTDMVYYASGALGLPGAMFTASHNPAQYNGIKLCHAGARPVGQDSGLAEVRDRAQALLDKDEPLGEPTAPTQRRDLLPDYAAHLRTLVDLANIRPLTVVVDAGNGMGGHTVPSVLGDAVLEALPLRIVPLYFELDGTFPNHEANPLDPANLVDLQRAVVAHGADIGLAFDGDADRCFVVDERGEPVSPSAITALVAARELAKHPGATVIHNLITSSAVPEIIREHGGEPVVARVGHSFIKAEMARTNAVFGGEHSAHYYFRDFWFADTGMLAAMHTLAALGEQPLPLSTLAAEYERYVASGEINSTVADQAAKVAEVRAAYPEAEADEMDGLTLRFPDGAWFNLRASNTEPLLRLNVEAPTAERMAALRDEVLDRVRR